MWSFTILFLVMYIGLITPVRIAFLEDNGEYFVIDTIIDVCFLLDIILNFFFIEDNAVGETMYEQKDIVIHYLTGWFWVDLISSIPIELFTRSMNGSSKGTLGIKFAKFMKAARLYKMVKVIKIVNKKHKGLEAIMSKISIPP
jgi:hypothetical protein